MVAPIVFGNDSEREWVPHVTVINRSNDPQKGHGLRTELSESREGSIQGPGLMLSIARMGFGAMPAMSADHRSPLVELSAFR